jgi:hypothetical protein
MKKIFLIIAAVVSFAIHGNAQSHKTDYRDKLLFGFKVGANYSNVYDTQGEGFNTSPKLGFATGAFLSIPIGKYIGIQPEILFSQKGFKATSSINGTPYSFTRTTSYLDLPLLFAFKPNAFITVLAGPQFSYRLHQRDTYSNSNTVIVNDKDYNNNNIRKNILCFTGGLDINLRHLVLGARAGWDIQDNNGDGTSTQPRYRNVWYQATIGYRFL